MVLTDPNGMALSHIQVFRGTFDPSDLEQATAVAELIANELRRSLDNFERLDTLKNQDGRFLWLAHFGKQTPLEVDAIRDLIAAFRDQVKEAGVSFEIEESGPYEVTYSGPSDAPTAPAD
jgi:hypothetical protein